MPIIGIISDTHGELDPRILTYFRGVDHILHAGDIGLPYLILELEALAPVTAVAGNCDCGLSYRPLEKLHLHGRKFLLHHQVEPQAPADWLSRLLIRENPDVVVFGHTHRRFCERVRTTLFINPGYAGKPRPGQPRSVARLHCDPLEVTAEFLSLD
jgi:uncharacterized protein